jgi:hypothetical protein
MSCRPSCDKDCGRALTSLPDFLHRRFAAARRASNSIGRTDTRLGLHASHHPNKCLHRSVRKVSPMRKAQVNHGDYEVCANLTAANRTTSVCARQRQLRSSWSELCGLLAAQAGDGDLHTQSLTFSFERSNLAAGTWSEPEGSTNSQQGRSARKTGARDNREDLRY